jgi:hypothetical protein
MIAVVRLCSGRFSAQAALVLASALCSITAAAQPIRLEIHPRIGDTLRLRLEQRVDMQATTRIGKRDSTITSSTTMDVFARAVVQTSDAKGAMLLAITDSVHVSATGTTIPAELDRSRKALQGARIRMRVFPDGSSEILSDPGSVAEELRAMVGQMPATLPDHPVTVGATWSRVVGIPLDGTNGLQRAAALSTTFRLDSLSLSSSVAFISLRGELTHDPGAGASAAAGDAPMSGKIIGSLQVDRKRGWLTDSRASVTLTTMLAPADPKGEPMRLTFTITQRMRAIGER